MSNYEVQYLSNLRSILEDGVEEINERTGSVTRRLPSSVISVDVSKELPILTSKEIKWKSAIEEMLWIFIQCDNDTKNLTSHIWDKHAYPDGTLGKSYGYQAGKKVKVNGITYDSQIDYIIGTLKNDSSSRQCVVSLWDPEDLHEMSLPPCIINSVWSIVDGKLYCLLAQRSADYPLGVPFDTFEHAVLMHLIARELSTPEKPIVPGILTHIFGDSHVYGNQIEPVTEWLKDATMHPLPTIKIADKPLKELTKDDFELINYEHGPYLKLSLN